jgi:hypothetical protein
VNKDIILAIIKSPFCLAIISFLFALYVMNTVVVPIVHVVTDTMPNKMDVIISKLDTCLSERVASKPTERNAQ